MPSIAVAQL